LTARRRVFITGGTGYLGRALIPLLLERGRRAARAAGVRHSVYVSVAQPAPVMKAYQEARAEVEAALKESGVPATVLRPWYVLGPGHRWPYLLKPFYYVCERLPSTRETARRLGFVTHAQMTAALLRAVEDPAPDFRLVTVPDIRAAA
jgi:uncharacterized protein YbjT (DUF2867 family)